MFQNPEKKNKASPNSMLLNDVKADNKKLPPQIGNEAINQLISAEGGGNNGKGNNGGNGSGANQVINALAEAAAEIKGDEPGIEKKNNASVPDAAAPQKKKQMFYKDPENDK